MTIQFHIGKIGQRRAVQDPRRLLEVAEGRYSDGALQLSDDQKYPVANKAPVSQPFVVRQVVSS